MATTIKISESLRDAINVAAAARGKTAGSFVEEIFEAWLADQRFKKLREQIAATPAEDMAEYLREAAEFLDPDLTSPPSQDLADSA